MGDRRNELVEVRRVPPANQVGAVPVSVGLDRDCVALGDAISGESQGTLGALGLSFGAGCFHRLVPFS